MILARKQCSKISTKLFPGMFTETTAQCNSVSGLLVHRKVMSSITAGKVPTQI